MSVFALMVSAHPNDRASLHALQLARAASAGGHSLAMVFFIHDGANIADNRRDTPLSDQWRALAEQAHCELVVCSGSANERNILDTPSARRQGLAQATLREGFVIGGLAQWQAAASTATRTLRLGA
ncbi:sulfurtransferase TusD [Spongiibacter sp. KMU-166]|uniref:Sulfurtransferase TusD n=1 Tax=Spongiibacter thalassae TaxID=2721624 RepID=A0ABX1GEC7_9GAMM|nr:DsrE family protein [Spongiibacter thalassae]NKI17310.1 sulfurtransferase TusD [Spongiibacter thalassae]